MIQTKKCFLYSVLLIFIFSILTSAYVYDYAVTRAEKECNRIIKSRIANDLIAFDMNRTDIVKYMTAFETAHTIIEIGQVNNIKSHEFMCEYWNNDFEKSISIILEQKQSDNNLTSSKYYEQGIKILNSQCN